MRPCQEKSKRENIDVEGSITYGHDYLETHQSNKVRHNNRTATQDTLHR